LRSYKTPDQTTTSLYKVAADGTETLFATLNKEAILDGNTIALADSGNAAGFVPGDVFLPQTPGPVPDNSLPGRF
jgi:hypothetical protein